MDASTRQRCLMASAGAVVALLGLGVAGCEKLQNASAEPDRVAVDAMAAGKIEDAAAQKGASPAIRATVNSRLSARRYDEGVDSQAVALAALLDTQRLSWQANRFATMAEQNLDSARDLSRYDPAASLIKADQVIGEIRGASDKLTRNVQGIELATLTKLDADIEKFNADIAAADKEVADLTTAQQQLTAQADQLEAQSKDATGQKSVDLFRQASGIRKQAADTAVKLEQAQARLVPLHQDLATAQEQKEILTVSVGQVDLLKGQISEGWNNVSKQAVTRTAIAQALVGKTPELRRLNLVQTVKELENVGRGAEEPLAKAQAAFKGAQDSAHEAAAAAAQAHKQAADRMSVARGTPTEVSLRSLQNTFSPGAYKLNELLAQYALGRSQGDQAAMLKLREAALLQFAATAGRVAYNVPADLKADPVVSASKEASDRALETLKKTDEALRDTEPMLSTTGQAKPTASVARMMTLLAAADVASGAGDKETAAQYTKEAKDVRDAVPVDTKLPELPSPLNTAPPAAPAQ